MLERLIVIALLETQANFKRLTKLKRVSVVIKLGKRLRRVLASTRILSYNVKYVLIYMKKGYSLD